ncbi:hypothetical protein L5515_012194 [Caenorhabditis briggsae]|uniref:T20D4.11-like domain-containing protein n=1 Tax=Caenorhabditis briggsae TaxID=6238 RepID=A0AAE9EXK0_CAEBR|nr:hypothetical protein L5515_012194 [Caenorhabditis briggsae]
MAKPKAKKQKLPFVPIPKVHRVQEIPAHERDPSPPPRYEEPACCTSTLVLFFFMILITFSSFLIYNFWPVRVQCTKAETVLHKSCIEKIERIKAILDTTIPDFSATPIGRDVAKKCQEMDDCLYAIECRSLKLNDSLPDRCAIYQFFETDFKKCRERMEKMIDLPVCVTKFLSTTGPIECDVLQEHVECYKEHVSLICDDESSLFHFWLRRHIDDYAQIIQCQLEY